MVISELSAGGGHCTTWSAASSVRQTLLPFEDVQLDSQSCARSRAQQQLLWDTLQSLKDKAAHAFSPVDASQPLDPFRETFSDGGLFGAGCNYVVGFYGIQGRQPKSEDYVLHLALGPNLFSAFDDCTRACLACVLDGHGGTGAVQYVAERFPSYLLADLPRLRAQPAAAMRLALHRIDEELTALGHNSGTTVNALVLIDNHITVVNTGDCRCILYDWVDERAVQVTHDHNLQCTRERERVLGEGAELSGCGGYVVLPCPTDGAKLLGVTKALGHAGVKALQRSFTMGSLTGILEAAPSPRRGQPAGQPLLQRLSQQLEHRGHHQARSQLSEQSLAMGGGFKASVSSSCYGFASWGQVAQSCEGIATAPAAVASEAVRTGTAGEAVSGSGMSDDDPVMPAPAATPSGVLQTGPGTGFLADMDMCPSCSALTLSSSCLQLTRAHGREGLTVSGNDTASVPGAAIPATAIIGRTTCNSSYGCVASISCSAATGAIAAATMPVLLSSQRCSSTGNSSRKSSFATAAGAAVAAVVAGAPESFIDLACSETVASQVLPLAATGTGGSFVLTCEPDEFEFTVEDDRHMVLLGCDGVFDRMGNAEACKTAVRQLTASNSCIDAAREVTHRACRLGSLDNITALVMRFGRKPIVRRQSFSVLSLRRSSSNTSGDLAATGGSLTSRA